MVSAGQGGKIDNDRHNQRSVEDGLGSKDDLENLSLLVIEPTDFSVGQRGQATVKLAAQGQKCDKGENAQSNYHVKDDLASDSSPRGHKVFFCSSEARNVSSYKD